MTAEDVINDALVELGQEPNEALIALVLSIIPSDIKALAQEWGMADTEVREKIYNVIEYCLVAN